MQGEEIRRQTHLRGRPPSELTLHLQTALHVNFLSLYPFNGSRTSTQTELRLIHCLCPLDDTVMDCFTVWPLTWKPYRACVEHQEQPLEGTMCSCASVNTLTDTWLRCARKWLNSWWIRQSACFFRFKLGMKFQLGRWWEIKRGKKTKKNKTQDFQNS